MLFGKKKIQILGKQINGATKLFHLCWDITPKRHLSKEMVFQWYSCQMSLNQFFSISFYPTKARYFSQFIMNQHRRFQLKGEKSVSKWLLIVKSSLDKSCQRTKLFLTPWNHVFLNFCLKCNCQDRQPSPSIVNCSSVSPPF